MKRLFMVVCIVVGCLLAEVALFNEIVTLQRLEDANKAAVDQSSMPAPQDMTPDEAQVGKISANSPLVSCATTWTHQAPDYVNEKGQVLLTPNQTRVLGKVGFKVIGWEGVPGTRVTLYRQLHEKWATLTWETPHWGYRQHAKLGVVKIFIATDEKSVTTIKCATRWWPEHETGFGHLPLYADYAQSVHSHNPQASHTIGTSCARRQTGNPPFILKSVNSKQHNCNSHCNIQTCSFAIHWYKTTCIALF
jgi:hypothetical protein